MITKYFRLLLFLVLPFISQSCSQHRLRMGNSDTCPNESGSESSSKRARLEDKSTKKTRAFSSWTPQMLREELGFEFDPSNIEIFKVEDLIGNEIGPSQKRTDGILWVFKENLESLHGFSYAKKEAAFSSYVDIIIKTMTNEVSEQLNIQPSNKNFLKVILKHGYEGDIAHGAVELVTCFKKQGVKDIILFISEVKKPSTLTDGLLHNCMELQAAYQYNPH